jgi:3-oxoacid CoA-transferase subunit B
VYGNAARNFNPVMAMAAKVTIVEVEQTVPVGELDRGAMDIATGARRLIVIMEHSMKDGSPKILRRWSYPPTAQRCVNTIITDLAVIDVTSDGLLLREVAPGLTYREVQDLTEPPRAVMGVLREMRFQI